MSAFRLVLWLAALLLAFQHQTRGTQCEQTKCERATNNSDFNPHPPPDAGSPDSWFEGWYLRVSDAGGSGASFGVGIGHFPGARGGGGYGRDHAGGQPFICGPRWGRVVSLLGQGSGRQLAPVRPLTRGRRADGVCRCEGGVQERGASLSMAAAL